MSTNDYYTAPGVGHADRAGVDPGGHFLEARLRKPFLMGLRKNLYNRLGLA
jgi:hypothetical protein